VIIETAHFTWRVLLTTRLLANALGPLLLVGCGSTQTAIKREVVVGRTTVEFEAARQIVAGAIRPL
jgi:hypothetical protein